MLYPKNFEQKVGFDEIRKLIKGRCLSTLGVEEVDRMRFKTKKEEIERLLKQVDEMRDILENAEDFPSDNYTDMRGALVRIHAAGSYMDEADLYGLRNSLTAISALVAFLDRRVPDQEETPLYPALKECANEVECYPMIVESVDRVLNKFGHIRDDASPTLLKVRTDMVNAKRNVSMTLHALLRSAQQEGLVEKDATPTMRDGRLVIPVAPALKKKIKGIVHDESASGKTVFIEPQEVVDGNNYIRQLELEERRAVIEVLMTVSNLIRPHIDSLLDAYHFLGMIDCIRAKAVFSESIGAVNTPVEEEPVMEWYEARHPLLEMSLRKRQREISPLDIKVGEKNRIVLISGPNAGGKSVCLKTAGLMQYMYQCGLPISVGRGSRTGIFESVFIDIGDEQSLENDLSTYSSHLLNMKFMLKSCNRNTLILIDEFGSGTEPQIGAAMSEALLERFLKSGTMGIITTHYQNLKYFAESNEGIVNAAMLYDRQLMQPLFQLQTGHAGSSFAIEIARKTGIPEEVIADASQKVGTDYIQSDKYVQDIVRDKRYWENKRSNIHQREKRLEELIERYENNLKELERMRKEVLVQAREKAETLLRDSNAQIENTIRAIREVQAEKEQTKEIRQALEDFKEEVLQGGDDAEDRIARKMEQIKQRRERQQQRKLQKKNTPQQTQQTNEIHTEQKEKEDVTWKPGMYARVKGQTSVGCIVKTDGRSATLQMGMMQLNIAVNKLVATDKPVENDQQTPYSYIGKATRDEIYAKKLKFHPEIDVRGMRGEEALNAVTYFMDDAILLGVSRVRILHGTGSGYLRMIIRQYLNALPNVASAKDEHVQFGGAGITVVEIK